MDNQEKLKTSKPKSFVINRKEGPFELAKTSIERLQSGDFSPEEIERLEKSFSRLRENVRQAQAGEAAFLETRQFPPDLTQAVRLAIADLFGEFVTAEEIDEFSMPKIWELLQTAYDRRQWLGKVVPTSPPVFALECFDVEFTNPCEAGSDTELTDDESAAFEKLVNHFWTMFEHDIPDGELLAYWWWDFLRGPLRNVRVFTDEFRRSRAGLIRKNILFEIAREAQINCNNLSNFSLIELLEAMMTAHEDAAEKTILKTAARSNSTVDQDRLSFYESELAKNKRLKYKQAAELWNRKELDICDEGSFKQSCYRARKRNKT